MHKFMVGLYSYSGAYLTHYTSTASFEYTDLFKESIKRLKNYNGGWMVWGGGS